MSDKNRFSEILEIAKNQGEEEAYEDEQEKQPEITQKRGRPKVGKRSNMDYTQITAYIRSATHKNTKIALIEEASGKTKRDMGDLIDELLSEWLKSHK